MMRIELFGCKFKQSLFGDRAMIALREFFEQLIGGFWLFLRLKHMRQAEFALVGDGQIAELR